MEGSAQSEALDPPRVPVPTALESGDANRQFSAWRVAAYLSDAAALMDRSLNWGSSRVRRL